MIMFIYAYKYKHILLYAYIILKHLSDFSLVYTFFLQWLNFLQLAYIIFMTNETTELFLSELNK